MVMAAAVAVLIFALARIGGALKQLKRRIEKLEAPPVEDGWMGPNAAGIHRNRRPMLGAIMEESWSPLAGFGRWPGGRFALGAGGLALVALIVALAADDPRPDPKLGEEVAELRIGFDSLTKLVAALEMSAAKSAVVAGSALSPKTDARAAATTPVSRGKPAFVVQANRPPGTKGRGTELPPAPSLAGPATSLVPAKLDSIK